MRFSRDFGELMSAVWLTLLYFAVVWPFRLVARLERGGWHPASKRPADALADARLEG